MSKQFDMVKAIRAYANLAYAAQAAGVAPGQIIGVKAKSELPQIKFIRDYKPMLDQVLKDMDSEFTALRSGA